MKAGNAVGRGDSAVRQQYIKRLELCAAVCRTAVLLPGRLSEGSEGCRQHWQCGSAAASGKSWHLRSNKRARLQLWLLLLLLLSFTTMLYDDFQQQVTPSRGKILVLHFLISKKKNLSVTTQHERAFIQTPTVSQMEKLQTPPHISWKKTDFLLRVGL